MLGKLAKQLRMFGFDVQYIKPRANEIYNPISLLKLAQQEKRIILTRNTKLKPYPKVFFITSENFQLQIQQIIEHFKVAKEINLFSRCLVCNEVLMPVPKSEVKNKVPFYIFQTKKKFSFCPKCQKIYWAGTHLKDMKKRLGKII